MIQEPTSHEAEVTRQRRTQLILSFSEGVLLRDTRVCLNPN